MSTTRVFARHPSTGWLVTVPGGATTAVPLKWGTGLYPSGVYRRDEGEMLPRGWSSMADRRRALAGSIVVAGMVSGAFLLGPVPTAGAEEAVFAPAVAVTSPAPAAASWSAPNDVLVDGSGRLLVADFAANGLLRRGTDGAWSVVAPFGTHAEAMWNPSAVAEAPDGRLVVAEAGRRTLAVLDAGGRVESRIGTTSSRAVQQIVVVGDDAVVVTGAAQVGVLDLPTSTWSVLPGPWTGASGIAVDRRTGAVYVSDTGVDDVWRLDGLDDATPERLRLPADPRTVVRGMSVDVTGALFVVDNGLDTVLEFADDTWSTVLSATGDGVRLADPTAVATAPDGSIAVADYNRRRIVTAERTIPFSSPVVVGQPSDVEVNQVSGQPVPQATFSVAVGGVPTPTVTWEVAGVDDDWIAVGASGAQLVLPGVDPRRVRAIVSNPLGTVRSDVARLSVVVETPPAPGPTPAPETPPAPGPAPAPVPVPAPEGVVDEGRGQSSGLVGASAGRGTQSRPGITAPAVTEGAARPDTGALAFTGGGEVVGAVLFGAGLVAGGGIALVRFRSGARSKPRRS